MKAVRSLVISAALFCGTVIAQEFAIPNHKESAQEFEGFKEWETGKATQAQESYSISGKASVNSFEVNESFYIALNGKVADTYHVFWRNPGTLGLPITATLNAPEGFKVEGPYWAVPRRVVGDFSTSYSYEVPIAVWKVTPTAITEQNVEFTITSTAQACNDIGIHAPETKTATISLSAGDGAPNPDWAAEETKTEVLGDTPLTVTASQTVDKVTLNISGVDTIENAYFFSDDNSIYPVAEQKLTKTDNGYTLTLPRNDNKDDLHPVKDEATVGQELCELKGILTFDDKHTVVQYTFSPAIKKHSTITPLPKGIKFTTGDKPVWNDWTPTIIEDCLKAGYPVYADFTANWCTNCMVNKKVAYTPQTCALFKNKQVVMVKVDLTDLKAEGDVEKEKLSDLLTANNRNNQLPINVLYIPSAQEGEQPKRLLTESRLTPEYLQTFLKDALKDANISWPSSQIKNSAITHEVTTKSTPTPTTSIYTYVILLIGVGITIAFTFSNISRENRTYVISVLYVISSTLITLYLHDKMGVATMGLIITLTSYTAVFWALQRWFVNKKK